MEALDALDQSLGALGAGVADPQVWRGRLGGEVRVPGGHRDTGSQRGRGELPYVPAVWQPQPEVVAAVRQSLRQQLGRQPGRRAGHHLPPIAQRGAARRPACAGGAARRALPGDRGALDGFGPWTVTGLRGLLAAGFAGAALLVVRAPLPTRVDRFAFAVVAVGCVLGFPLPTTPASQTSSTAHSAA
ncbi:hypothetical protein ACIBSV_00810 [Embleya sp. NPDC050154]|uniref:hypothetical protein n=1 Tax=Embleya sp. NPDC050154 TaxID=3363988 RepID=UPI0037AD728D